MSGRLDGRRVIVTGAGSGIGAATAARLAADGARVFGTDRQGAVDFTADVTGAGASDEIVARAIAALGGVDGVVACAGMT